ncbi:hypothetical protein L9F63_002869 [Diploptera punctata]|uniref:Uncharacterized protein n=1 Tax=Diploptera punctata TaxID=6984 RepID=A0AAD7ZRF3_DIPPU|nr:hypothetical protein L9F63_002869 [Diploptera punctata]
MMIVLLLLLPINTAFCILNIQLENNNLDQEISKSILEICTKYFFNISHIFIQSLSMETGNYENRGPYNYIHGLEKLHEKSGIPVIMYSYKDHFTWNIKKPEDSQALLFILPKTSIPIQLRLFAKFITKINEHIIYPIMKIVVISSTAPTIAIEKLGAANIVQNLVWYHLREANTIYIIPRDTNKNQSNILEVYSWFPDRQTQFCFHNLHKITRIALWIPGRSKFTHDLFPSKDIKDMRNCKISVTLYNMPPYLMIDQNNRLHKYDISLPLSLQPKTYSRWRRFLTYSLFISSNSWYVPVIPIPKWQSIIRIFNIEMWIMVAVTYLLGTIIFWLLKGRNDPVKAFTDTLRTFLCFGIPENFQGALSTIFFSLWLFFCLLINTAYQSCLIGFMADPGIYPPITHLDELETSGFIKESCIAFRNSDVYGTGENVSVNLSSCGNIETCIDKMIHFKKSATLGPTIFTNMLLDYISIDKPRREIIGLKPDFSITHFVANIELGPLLVNIFDNVTSSLFSAGVMDYAHKKMYLLANNIVKKMFPPKEKIFALTLSHVQGPFYVLIVGLILALIAFVAEMLRKA